MKFLYLIGAAAGKIAADLEGAPLYQAGDLETAVDLALERAAPGDVVLLSPACSSYDQFRDFEERGRAFKQIVQRLAKQPRLETPPAAPNREMEREFVEEQTAPAPAAAGEPEEHASPLAAHTETPRSEESLVHEAPIAPAYIYEVESEDLPPGEPEVASLGPPEHLGSVSENELIEDDSPLLPYEVPRPADTARRKEAIGGEREPAAHAPAVNNRPEGETQPGLFGGDLKGPRTDEGA